MIQQIKLISFLFLVTIASLCNPGKKGRTKIPNPIKDTQYTANAVIATKKTGQVQLAGEKKPLLNTLQNIIDKSKKEYIVKEVRIVESSFTYFLSIITADQLQKKVSFFVELATSDGVSFRPIGGNAPVPTCISLANCAPDLPNNYPGCSIFKFGDPLALQTGCNCGGDSSLANQPANGNTPQVNCNFKYSRRISKDFVMALDKGLKTIRWALN